MAEFARKQLEKWGWKEGEGLGRNKDGMSNYIKTSRHNRATHNRDERGNTYAGIGHESTRGAGAGFSERNNELESVFAEMAQQRKEKKKKEQAQKGSSSSSSDDDEGEVDKKKIEVNDRKKKSTTQHEHNDSRRRQRDEVDEKNGEGHSLAQKQKEGANASSSSSSSKNQRATASSSASRSPSRPSPKSADQISSSKRTAVVVSASTKKTAATSASDSSSSSSDDDDGGENRSGDLTKMSDAELFARCGGVRLGRAGRHRLFDNKLKRIEEHNASATHDPYAAVRQGKKKL